MLNITNELKKKLSTAQSAEEAAELVKADGQEITAEEAGHLWEEITKRREQDGQELSLDELEAVSGGADRDWRKHGCAATVEPGSSCFSNDFCYLIDVTYSNPPTSKLGGGSGKKVGTCPKCGGYLCFDSWTADGKTGKVYCRVCDDYYFIDK